MRPSMLEFLQMILATWRVSRLLVREDGPGEYIAKLRDRVGVKYDAHGDPYADEGNFWGGLLSCVFCTSVWVAPLAILFRRSLTVILAVSGGAILIERLFYVRLHR